MLYVVRDSDEGEFILQFNKAQWHVCCCSGEFEEPLPHELAMLILTGREYVPAWVMALEDTEFYLASRPQVLENPSEALTLFGRSLRYHLECQPDDGCFLLEHPKGSGHYHWIVGYTQVWDGVLYIEGGITYPSAASDFGLSSEKMKSRFPDTPRHLTEKQGLGEDYIPPSLSQDPKDRRKGTRRKKRQRSQKKLKS